MGTEKNCALDPQVALQFSTSTAPSESAGVAYEKGQEQAPCSALLDQTEDLLVDYEIDDKTTNTIGSPSPTAALEAEVQTDIQVIDNTELAVQSATEPMPNYEAFQSTNIAYRMLKDTITPDEILVTDQNIQPQVVVDYVRSMGTVDAAIQERPHQSIVLPDRGAMPLKITLQEYADFKGHPHPNYISVPIGTHYGDLNGRQKGINFTKKRDIVRDALDFYGVNADTHDNVAVVDEAQSGSTSATAATLVREVLDPNIGVTYIACKDTRKNIIGRPGSPNFFKLVSNTVPGIDGFVIPVPLFYIDRPAFLDTLVHPEVVKGDEARELRGGHMMMHKIHNTEAQNLFRQMARFVFYPEILESTMQGKEIESHPYSASALRWKQGVEASIEKHELMKNSDASHIVGHKKDEFNSWLSKLLHAVSS